MTRQYQATPVQLMVVLNVCQGCRILNLYCQTASSPKSISSISSSTYDVDEAVETGPGEQTRQAVTLQWTRPSSFQSSVAYTYKGGPRGKKGNEASHINDGSSPVCRNYHSLGGGDKPLLSWLHRRTWRWTLSWTWRYWSQNVCVSGTESAEGTWCKRQTDRLLVNIGSTTHTFLRDHDEPGQIISHPFTSILLTTGINLLGRTKILTDLFEILNKNFPNFTTLLEIWLLTKVSFLSKGGTFSNSSYKKTQAFRHQNFQTLSLDWI